MSSPEGDRDPASDLASDLAVARRAALRGAQVALGYFGALADLPREAKADGSVVTEADRAVEAAVRAVLAEARPGDAVLGEEAGQTGHADRRWIVDPIDGTAQFVAGDDRWLVLVALQQAGEIVVGVAAVPAQGRIWWAARGGGAWEAGLAGAVVSDARRVHVAGEPAGDASHDASHDASGDPSGGVAGARLGIVPPDENLRAADRALISALCTETSPVPWTTHAALLVARGDLDVAVQTRGHLWDFAATSLIVSEAGGRYSGADGDPRPKAGPSVFTRSTRLHDAVLELLADQRTG